MITDRNPAALFSIVVDRIPPELRNSFFNDLAAALAILAPADPLLLAGKLARSFTARAAMAMLDGDFCARHGGE